jgi:hypothetical protein
VATFLVSPQPAFSDDTLEYSFLFDSQPNESVDGYQERHAALLGYEPDIADEWALGYTMSGTPYYAETHGESGSALAAIRPPDEMQTDGTGRGLWCLIESVDDNTNPSQTVWRLTVGVRYLADLAEYADAAAVRDDFEREGIGVS